MAWAQNKVSKNYLGPSFKQLKGFLRPPPTQTLQYNGKGNDHQPKPYMPKGLLQATFKSLSLKIQLALYLFKTCEVKHISQFMSALINKTLK